MNIIREFLEKHYRRGDQTVNRHQFLADLNRYLAQLDQPQVTPNQLHHWLSGRGVPRRLAGLNTEHFLEIIATKPERILLIAVPADAGRIATLETAASATGDSVEEWLKDIIEGMIARQ